uniref:CBM20 domain-containing protein n=1 Tax=Tetradesmus obliquus TaxID=3088 RepID=A0A383WH22_TETOB|eukprot:jgi/Sobl393_1/10821/SZX61875.1
MLQQRSLLRSGRGSSCSRGLVQHRISRAPLQCYAKDKAETAEKVPVRFRIRQKVEYGERFKVVGNQPGLGSWDVTKAPELKWHDGDLWAGSVDLPVGKDIEFKCVRVTSGGENWEDGNNRKFKALGPRYSLDIRCTWNSTRNTDVHAHELKPEEPPFRELSSLQSLDHAAAEAEALASRREEERERSRQASYSSMSSYSDSDSEAGHVAGWQGKQVEFMRSNQHSRERNGVWDTSGLPPAPHPLQTLVRGDEHAANWLKKLEVAKTVLVDEAVRARPSVEALAAGFVYLQWVTTGAIACVEGGGHYRPNHHARVAQHIFRSCEWAIEDDREPARAATLLARKLSTRLPSFGEAFTQTVPLTRIRDIAHRNDIPSDLKQEIKHTLQNKLHRNAGPEDLVAAEAMLNRINNGQYSGAFVNEFKIFVAELREFFNAATFTQLLDAVKVGMSNEDTQVIDFFLGQKAALDSKQNPSPEDLVATCHALTTVRALLMGGLNSGLRNDAPDAALAMRQRWRLAEVRAEDYAFVLLSRLDNALEQQGGGAALLNAHDLAWAPVLGGLVLGLRHLGLGGLAPAEAMAIEAELVAWQKEGNYRDRDNALRLKATLERMQRFTEQYLELLLKLLPPVAEALGKALGVAPYAITTFTEAEIRANVVFQVSKLTTLLLRACRTAAGSSSWDPLVAGTAVGKLVELQELDPAVLAGFNEPVVVLLRSASGDEEVGASGNALQGVVLTQDLPHLSHLGVRARQERVPFAILDDPSVAAQDVAPLLGQHIALTVTPDSVTIAPATAEQLAAAAAAAGGKARAGAAAANGGASKQQEGGEAAGGPAGAVSKVSSVRMLPLLDCMPTLAGAKASSCARLEQISLEAKAAEAFQTPRGCCVPFGVMELALAALPYEQQDRYKQLLAASETAGLAELTGISEELQALVGSLSLPDNLLKSLAGTFQPGSLLICRSSANVEDLAGMSGAGLYESVPNVPSDRPGDISAAVAAVWASLYTRRAILSRRAAGVAQSDACMAVLVQELLFPTYSFVLHTASPLNGNPLAAEVEIAAGLGETLASGKRGSAWRLEINKSTGEVKTLAFANFSEALLPSSAVKPAPAGGNGGSVETAELPPIGSASLASMLAGVGPAGWKSGGLYSKANTAGGGGSSGGSTPTGLSWSGSSLSNSPSSSRDEGSGVARAGELYECVGRTMDYSRHGLSKSSDVRQALGRRIGAVAGLLERQFGGAQDVEGCFVGDLLYVVQTRPQP